MEALQRYAEITGAHRQNYRDQIKAHFGVDPGLRSSNMCQYLDGCSNTIDINEVVNTNLASGEYDADIAGKGIGSGNGHLKFETREHGVFMCIYHALPLLDYASSLCIDPICGKYQFSDYALPEYDKLGLQQLRKDWFGAANPNRSVGSIKQSDMGYAPRYIEYKTAVDKIHGAFERSLGYWVAPYSAILPSKLDYSVFKVYPGVLDNIFTQSVDSFVDTDQLLCNVFFDIKSVRNLDYYGLPF